MKVMLFESANALGEMRTHIHCRRYLHFLQLAECDVIFVQHRGVQTLNMPNVRCRRYPWRYRPVAKVFGLRAAHYLREQSLRRLWRLVNPDICHVQWITDELWHIARAGLRPLVATAWGSDLNIPAKSSADDPFRQKISDALRSIDHLIIDSDDMGATAEQLAGKKLNTTLLPIGIDTQRFHPGLYQERSEWREKLKIDPTATVILAARQLGANYRSAEIIHAFAALKNSCRKQVYLIMRTFGHAIGVSLDQLRELANKSHISNNIRWVGDLEYSQLPGLYAASDLVVNFAIMDAFPVTFLECFACGLPVVSNRLVSYASNGMEPYLFFAEDNSVSGLKTAIEAAIERLDELKILADKARDRVVRNFDERETARVLRQTYEAVLSTELK
jgi:glycosyltransferase involved in cell wall biosynthesis